MNATNWPRIIMCGLIVGVVFTLLSAVLVGLVGSEFLAAAGPGAAGTGPGLYFATVLAGIWAMWLYAVVRPQVPGNPAAVITVSLAWWLIAGLQSAKWVLLLDLPLSAVLPLAGNVVPTGIAVLVGSVLYERVGPARPLHP